MPYFQMMTQGWDNLWKEGKNRDMHSRGKFREVDVLKLSNQMILIQELWKD